MHHINRQVSTMNIIKYLRFAEGGGLVPTDIGGVSHAGDAAHPSIKSINIHRNLCLFINNYKICDAVGATATPPEPQEGERW